MRQISGYMLAFGLTQEEEIETVCMKNAAFNVRADPAPRRCAAAASSRRPEARVLQTKFSHTQRRTRPDLVVVRRAELRAHLRLLIGNVNPIRGGEQAPARRMRGLNRERSRHG
jgi:hypothetical protein